ncbi:ABC transporter ATP-binding protein [uncultured Bifidobacterium sp.]|uniref:ABC transporter ATP-binding protein n=1 Tax=uncultured Bifidobacterium sp. TaxID=165187 RepID=UPI00261AB98E|nr:ABC transporter ATP-binding protein [uncultured Bifidobacterium sp.]
MSRTSNAALNVQDLRVSIGSREIIHGVNLRLRRGTTLAVVGESGSGKSVTAKALCGLLPRDSSMSGEYELDGRSVDLSAGETVWRTIRGHGGIVWLPQDPFSSLNPLSTCGRQICSGSELPKRERADQARRLLRDVGLPADVYSAYPHELSGGMRQRAAIAAAVAPGPRVLIADEPTTALDAQTQEGVLRLLRNLSASRRMSLVLITHDLALAAAHADDIAVFHDGVVVEEASRDDVVLHPRSDYTRRLLGARVRGDTGHGGDAGVEGHLVVRAEHLVKTYPGAVEPAVQDVSLEVKRGEILGVVGESGSGKSTVARCLVGLEKPDSGSVAYIDSDGAELPWSRGRAQLVFQNPFGSLNPTMTVGQTLREALHVCGKPSDDAAVCTLLTEVGLDASIENLLDRKPGTLSGGQCQRVAIARSLVPDPELLVADEAVTALDAVIRVQVLDTMLRLRDDFGLAILFISHDLDVVRRVADRIIVMRAGEVVESGVTADVMDRSTNAYVRALVAAMPGNPLGGPGGPSGSTVKSEK